MNPAPPVTMILIVSPPASISSVPGGSFPHGTDPLQPERQLHARVVRLRLPFDGESDTPTVASRKHRPPNRPLGEEAVPDGVIQLRLDVEPAQQGPCERPPNVFRQIPGKAVLGE